MLPAIASAITLASTWLLCTDRAAESDFQQPAQPPSVAASRRAEITILRFDASFVFAINILISAVYIRRSTSRNRITSPVLHAPNSTDRPTHAHLPSMRHLQVEIRE